MRRLACVKIAMMLLLASSIGCNSQYIRHQDDKERSSVHLKRIENEYRYAYMSPNELSARLESKGILYLPMGSLEWHNEHLPLGTDTFHAIELSLRLCRSLGGVVLPAFWWNTGGCHDHASTYHMPEKDYRPTILNICKGLSPIPAKLLVLVNGHGGRYQKESPAIIADKLNKSGFPMRVVVADPYGLGRSSSVRIDHADTGETSFSLELIPQLVRMEREVEPDLFSKKKPFAKGRPDKEGGQELWDAYYSDAKELILKEYSLVE
jgi:creatinine amidohydrolase